MDRFPLTLTQNQFAFIWESVDYYDKQIDRRIYWANTDDEERRLTNLERKLSNIKGKLREEAEMQGRGDFVPTVNFSTGNAPEAPNNRSNEESGINYIFLSSSTNTNSGNNRTNSTITIRFLESELTMIFESIQANITEISNEINTLTVEGNNVDLEDIAIMNESRDRLMELSEYIQQAMSLPAAAARNNTRRRRNRKNKRKNRKTRRS
jgi:hypothetical protein